MRFRKTSTKSFKIVYNKKNSEAYISNLRVTTVPADGLALVDGMTSAGSVFKKLRMQIIWLRRPNEKIICLCLSAVDKNAIVYALIVLQFIPGNRRGSGYSYYSCRGGHCVSTCWFGSDTVTNCEVIYNLYVDVRNVYRCLTDGGKDGLRWPAPSRPWLSFSGCWQYLLSRKWLIS